MSAFDDLQAEVLAFHDRFGLDSLPDAVRVMHEEAGEVAARAIELDVRQKHSDFGQHYLRDELANEIADMIFTALGVAYQAGIDAEYLNIAMGRVTDKNARKTPETTSVVNGKVQKPSK